MTKILGIETSCDETSVSIVTDQKKILANLVFSQIDIHQAYGGVVPEIAARSHIESLEKLIKEVQKKSGLLLQDVDAIAVTSGPGLIGGLIVGVMMAKGLCHALQKPIIEINHLEGHALTARLTEEIEFPYLLLLVSGGHCQVLIVQNVGHYEMLGTTIDDALGEAFDKLSKMLKLGYPGGPIIEKMAENGDINAYRLPKAMIGRRGCDFSFSGLKTAMRKIISEEEITNAFIHNISASFQKTVCTILDDRLKNAFSIYEKKFPNNKRLVVSGGVAANKFIRNNLEKLVQKYNYKLYFPPIELCTDNAAMIAWAGIERYQQGYFSDLSIEPKARWPLSSKIQ